MQKIVVVGTSGAGKSTLAGQLAQKFTLTYIELDAVFWKTDWQPSKRPEFRQNVAQILDTTPGGWVIDGNYSMVRDIIWKQVDTVIWLDYALRVIYWRLFTRTLRRTLTREVLWGTNRESFRQAFLSKDSLFYWAHTTYHDRKERYNRIIAMNDYPHITFIRFSHPRQTAAWLNSLPNG